jgi:hypothetical protein
MKLNPNDKAIKQMFINLITNTVLEENNLEK